jgi:adenosine deaminase
MKSAFLPFDQRLAIIDEVVKLGYAALVTDGDDRAPRP